MSTRNGMTPREKCLSYTVTKYQNIEDNSPKFLPYCLIFPLLINLSLKSRLRTKLLHKQNLD